MEADLLDFMTKSASSEEIMSYLQLVENMNNCANVLTDNEFQNIISVITSQYPINNLPAVIEIISTNSAWPIVSNLIFRSLTLKEKTYLLSIFEAIFSFLLRMKQKKEKWHLSETDLFVTDIIKQLKRECQP